MKMLRPLTRSSKPLLSNEQQAAVVATIQQAERKTSGEIRVYVEAKCEFVHAVDRAEEIFLQLKMNETENRNAVLVYMALKDRQFAIYGDHQIYQKSGGPEFWKSAARHFHDFLVDGLVVEGLCACITELGEVLAQHYPFDAAVDKNELPDEIILGK